MPTSRSIQVLLCVLASAAAIAEEPERGPVLVEFHAAPYPPVALDRGFEAEVPCELKIGPNGTVADLTCDSGEDPAFVRAAAEALRRARFIPAQRGGVPVQSRLRFVYRFAVSASRLPEMEPLQYAGTISGEVLAGGIRQPLAGVEVVAQGVGRWALTDARGRFRLDVPPGEHLLVASAPEYAAGSQPLTVALGKEAQVTFYLRRTSVADLSATVPGERTRAGPTRSTVVQEELRNVPGSRNDPIRVIENLPGLARIPFTGGQLIVRGAQAQDTGAYIDGQRIPILYHLLEGPSVLGEDMVDRIDFYPGGAGVYFGRQIGGAVLVTSRRGDPDRFHGSIAADLNKSAAFLQGPLGSSTQFAVGGRHSYQNPFVAAITPPDEQVSIPIYWDYQARADHRFSAADRATLLFYGSGDSIDVVGGRRGTVSLVEARTISFHRARATWERRVSDQLSFSLAPAAGWDRSTLSLSGAGAGALARPQSQQDTTLSLALRADATYRPGDALELRTGLDLSNDHVSYKLDRLFDQQLRSLGAPNAVQTVLSGAKDFRGLGIYGETEVRTGGFRFTPGLRADVLGWPGHAYLTFDPRLWVRYAVDDATTLHAYAGVYHQAPTAEQIDPLIGNPGLLPLRSNQFGAGAERRFGQLWTVRVEGYLNLRSSLPFPVAARANGDGTFDNPLQLNTGEGRSLGFELLLRRELSSRLYGWIAYTLSRSRELPGPGQPWRPTQYDQPHVLTMLVGYRPSPYLELSGRMRVASGNPASAADGAVFNADSGEFSPRLLPFGARRLPPFVQLDLQLNNIWAEDTYRFQLYLDFQNVFGRRNAEALIYDFTYRSSDYVHGLPFLASVGAKLSF